MTISFMQISVTVQANRFPTVAGTDIDDDPILLRTDGPDEIGFAQAPIATSALLRILERWIQPQI